MVEGPYFLGNSVLPSLAGVERARGVKSSIFVHKLDINPPISQVWTIHLKPGGKSIGIVKLVKVAEWSQYLTRTVG